MTAKEHCSVEATTVACKKTILRSTENWYCSGLIRQFGIGKVVIGESVNFKGGEDWLRENGIEVIQMNSGECIQLMAAFIRKHPELWNEDIAAD